MSKTIIDNQEKGYELIQNDDGRLTLCVLCGGIGMYIAKIRLNTEETTLFNERGIDYLEDLAYDISHDSEKYEPRMVP